MTLSTSARWTVRPCRSSTAKRMTSCLDRPSASDNSLRAASSSSSVRSVMAMTLIVDLLVSDWYRLIVHDVAVLKLSFHSPDKLSG